MRSKLCPDLVGMRQGMRLKYRVRGRDGVKLMSSAGVPGVVGARGWSHGYDCFR